MSPSSARHRLRPLPLLCLILLAVAAPHATAADPATYLTNITAALRTDYPRNRTVTLVCHGHSVPSGYFKTPEVRQLEAYPHLLRAGLAARFPHAVFNVIVTAKGGEDSSQGALRFERDVLSLRPDVVTLDYALNDRRIGLERARAAWTAMIQQAQSRGVKVLLFTPTPDLKADLTRPDDPLTQHAAQIRALAREHDTGLVDSLAAFESFARDGGRLATEMAQGNHPNAAGHRRVADLLLAWFP